ncbi:MAG TPA: GntR family transcriptional regulator [Chthoniobacteraceae bacterium]|nr:GntR family transcriptional regulator [Chthoniobacteraceae bacterium]
MDANARINRKPLYRQVADLIRERYAEGKEPGTRLPSERDLIDLLNVSSITIRGALRELENERWIARQRGSGTYVLPRIQSSKHVALLLEADISSPQLSPFYPKMLQECRLALLKAGYPSRPYLGHLRLGVEIGELTCREFFDELHEDRIVGVIAILARPHPSWVSPLQKRSIPIVGNRKASGILVGTDPEKLTESVLKNFHDRGYRRLALIGYDDGYKPVPSCITRFPEKAAAYGLTVDPRHVNTTVSGLKPGEGRAALRKIWESGAPRPDCLFISSDPVANECIDELANLQAGDDFAVTVYSSDAITIRSRPNLVVCQHAVASGAAKLTQAMIQSIRGEAVPSFIETPFFMKGPVVSTPKAPAAPGDRSLIS